MNYGALLNPRMTKIKLLLHKRLFMMDLNTIINLIMISKDQSMGNYLGLIIMQKLKDKNSLQVMPIH